MLATLMHDRLSQNKVTIGIVSSFNSSSIALIHMPSFAAKAAATYSTSVDENATVVCFFDFHEIAAPASV